jgi:hypothetical protein
VFISYAREPDAPAHEESVIRLWTFLRACGLDARLDLGEAYERRDWALWMGRQLREADYVLVIASATYRRSAEGRGEVYEERGVQWEARLIRDAFYADQHALNRFIPVVLPGQSVDGVPDFLGPATSTVYSVSDFTVEGAEPLLRLLTNQPEFLRPPLGAVPALKPRTVPPATPVPPGRQPGAGVRNSITGDVTGFVIQAGSVGPVTLPSPGPRVGDGADPRTRKAFEDAFRRTGGRLGEPTGEAFAEGPGFVQQFTGESDAVVCAIAGKPAVAVAGPVWDDLSALPGFPEGPGFPGPSDYLDAAARVVDLDGGTWGAGVLLRDLDTRPARWQPKPRLTMNAREAFRLPIAGPADLTVRAIAILPWQLDDDLEITRRTRELIETALPHAGISALIPVLSRWRGTKITPPRWERASGPEVQQTGLHARYDQTSPAVRVVARLMLPSSSTSAITVSVEFQAAADFRVTANEIVELWTAAWHTATVVLPGALVPDPGHAALLAPPTVELHVKTERSLPDVADLSVFGTPEGQPGSQGAVTVVAPIGLGDNERRAWATTALTRMARGWGFAEADESDLDKRIR